MRFKIEKPPNGGDLRVEKRFAIYARTDDDWHVVLGNMFVVEVFSEALRQWNGLHCYNLQRLAYNKMSQIRDEKRNKG